MLKCIETKEEKKNYRDNICIGFAQFYNIYSETSEEAMGEEQNRILPRVCAARRDSPYMYTCMRPSATTGKGI